MRASGGSSLKETSWVISARVLTLNVLVMLMPIEIIFMSALRMPGDSRVCLMGS